MNFLNHKTFGPEKLRMLPGATLVEDKQGLMEGQVTWEAPNDRIMQLAPDLGSAHPYARFCTLEKRSFTFGGKGLATVKGNYAGMSPQRGEESPPTYELQIGTSEEPIVVHRRFATHIGGRPSAPLNGAIFIDPSTGDQTADDKLGVFDRFALWIEDEENDLAGVEAFLDANEIVWRKKYTARSRPQDLSDVGKIATPEGPEPSVNPEWNWRYNGMTYQERAHVFTVQKEWQLSGWRGWNKKIYDTA